MTPNEMLAYEEMRAEATRAAVAAADKVLIAACLGNPEVFLLLNSEVATAFAEKVNIMMREQVYNKDLLCELPPEALKHFMNAQEKKRSNYDFDGGA
jgi:hypothetical protein